MIERLLGTVLAKDPDLHLRVGPVTLRLEISDQTRRSLPERGAEAEVFTELIVREDSLGCVGFMTREERRLFVILIGVSGIGKRLALAILSELTVADLARTVSLEDAKRLTAVSGVGAKTASRLLLELSSKLGEFMPSAASGAAMSISDPSREEALLALVSLGMTRQTALKAITEFEGDDLPVEEIIRRALGASG